MSSNGTAGRRRRGDVLVAAILDAGWEQLCEAGYELFTIDAVAERASTARSVLYRRWPSRLALLEAVIRRRGQIDSIAVPDTGSLRGDVIALLTDIADRRAELIGLIAGRLGAYFDSAGGSPAELRGWLIPDGPPAMTILANRALARGELAAMPSARVLDLPVALLRHDMFMTMAAPRAGDIVELVDDVFLPLATRGTDHKE